MSKPTVVFPYNLQAATQLYANASSCGLGAVLKQKSQSTWRLVVYAYLSMTETKWLYTQIEQEASATTCAGKKFSTYILGKSFLIETDHKPLVSLLGTKHLDSLPA